MTISKITNKIKKRELTKKVNSFIVDIYVNTCIIYVFITKGCVN